MKYNFFQSFNIETGHLRSSGLVLTSYTPSHKTLIQMVRHPKGATNRGSQAFIMPRLRCDEEARILLPKCREHIKFTKLLPEILQYNFYSLDYK